jgi:SAM-dependent methyltransferase
VDKRSDAAPDFSTAAPVVERFRDSAVEETLADGAAAALSPARMDLIQHNRGAWNRASAGGIVWSIPVDPAKIAAARQNQFDVILTPHRPVPRDWFGDMRGKRVFCLASGGGQQAPIFAAAGAQVTSFDLSDEQLAKDRAVAQREGLALDCVRGDMADLGCFDDCIFDLVFHPASNVFVPDLAPVWRGCHRVLRPGGVLLAGFLNPLVFLFDHDEADRTGTLTVRYRLPYSDLASLAEDALRKKLAANEPLEFSHSLDAQIGGQIAAGFVITGFYEDGWLDDSWLLAQHTPVAIATRAERRA